MSGPSKRDLVLKAAADALASGAPVTVPTLRLLVVPDVRVLELIANGSSALAERAPLVTLADRTCVVLWLDDELWALAQRESS